MRQTMPEDRIIMRDRGNVGPGKGMTTETVCVQDEWRIDYRRLDSMWVLIYELTGWSMDFWSLPEAIDAMEIYANGLCLA